MSATTGFIKQSIKMDGLKYAVDRFNEMSIENREKYKNDFFNTGEKNVSWNDFSKTLHLNK